MKLFILILTFFTLTETILAQDSSFIDYNRLYQKAEMQILKGNYCGAMETYLELGENFNLKTTEKINGLVSSLECDSTVVESIEYFIQLLFEIGTPVDYFEDELGRYPYFSSNKWKKLILDKPEFDRNNKYIRKVDEMIKIDQAGRGYATKDSMEWADFRVYMMMQELSREMGGGLLGPDQLGFDFRPMGYRTNAQYSILLVHQIKSRPYEWGEYLPQMYFDWIIDHRQFTHYYTLAKACERKELSCFPHPPQNMLRINDQIFVCSGKARKRINENRNYFYLDSIEDQIAKSLFKASSDKPFRGIGRSIPIYSLPADADADEKEEFFRMVKEMGFEKWME